MNVSEYLDRYSDQSLLRGQLNDYTLSVASSLSLSLEEAEKQAPVACEVLKLLSFLGPDHITKHLIRQLLRAKKNIDEKRLRKQSAKRQNACKVAVICTAAVGTAMFLARRNNAKKSVLASLAATASVLSIPYLTEGTNRNQLRKAQSTISFSPFEYEQADIAWNVLKSFSLLSVKEGKGNIHRLLQQSTRACQDKSESEYNLMIVIDCLKSMWNFEASNSDSWKESLALLEHVKAAVSHCINHPLDSSHTMQAAQLSKDSAVFSALTLNAFSDAKASLDFSLKLYESTKSTKSRELLRAEALLELGRIFRYQGMYEDSKASLMGALDTFRTLYRKDLKVQKNIATALHEVGLLELKQHNLKDAEAHLIESLQLRRQSSSQDIDPECAATLHQLAAVNVSRKPPLLDKARILLIEALNVSSQIGQRAATLKQLARVTIREGHLDSAESYLEQALELYHEIYDNKSHMNIAAVRFQMVSVC